MVKELPLVGITLGDVAGIGPEVVAKALRHPEVHAVCRPLVIGDRRVFQTPKFAALWSPLEVTDDPTEARYDPQVLTVLDLHNLDPGAIEMGAVSAEAGRAAAEYVITATRLALEGTLDAIATAPLNKEALRLGGYDYIGHTEILADLTHTSRCTTMLATEGLRVTHVTRHLPFREIADHITRERVLDTILITAQGMRALGYAHPRLAVAGLNPHNGESGLLGREELEVITPAVVEARAHGLDVTGPIAADSIFFQAIRGDFDVVVCMYHDQGHIAVKTHGFEQSITITLGLPFPRTSADHGTAFDIAGKGIANERSMLAAILEAARLAQARKA